MLAFDTECYANFWLCAFSDGSKFVRTPSQPLDVVALSRKLKAATVVSFNGNAYDVPMIFKTFQGADNSNLLAHSNQLITDEDMPWSQKGRLKWIDHIDVFNVAPGKYSLKAYGGKMNYRKIQDLPIKPGATLTPEECELITTYCDNDIGVTQALYEQFKPQIELREKMGKEYGLDLRSKSDAQCAEAIARLKFPNVRIPKHEGQFYYRPPAWVKFFNLDILAILERSPFTIGKSGKPIMHDALGKQWLFTIGDMTYRVGSGGLHSTEKSVTHDVRGTDYVLRDFDVASMYPASIINNNITPDQLGFAFQEMYRGWRDERLRAKRSGDIDLSNFLKILLNGTFGKMGSRFSIFFTPQGLIQVTLSGQLALLMLIERMHMSGVKVLSANTDGIVLKYHKDMHPLVLAIIKQWESETNYEMEQTDYDAVFSRDVNSYIALKTDGKVKLKGMFAPPVPVAGSWPNPSGEICVTAIVEFLKHGTSIAKTIRECVDIRKFVYVYGVKGGGSYVAKPVLDKKLGKRKKTEMFGSVEAYDAEAAKPLDGEYLGKVVRWYYAVGSVGSIRTPKGHLVPSTEGCKPMMELTDGLPHDLDYQRYINEAVGLLKDVGWHPESASTSITHTSQALQVSA